MKYFLPAAIFLALGILFGVTLMRIGSGELDVREIESPLIGRAAPPFELPSLANPSEQVGTSTLAGTPYLLNVWGTWCGGCREEHDELLTIAKEGRIPIVGLNWKDDRALAQAWLDQLGNPYARVAFDPEGKVAIDWGVYGAPETFLVSASGVVLEKHIGPLTMDVWRQKFVPRLAEAGGPATAAAGAGS